VTPSTGWRGSTRRPILKQCADNSFLNLGIDAKVYSKLNGLVGFAAEFVEGGKDD